MTEYIDKTQFVETATGIYIIDGSDKVFVARKNLAELVDKAERHIRKYEGIKNN